MRCGWEAIERVPDAVDAVRDVVGRTKAVDGDASRGRGATTV